MLKTLFLSLLLFIVLMSIVNISLGGLPHTIALNAQNPIVVAQVEASQPRSEDSESEAESTSANPPDTHDSTANRQETEDTTRATADRKSAESAGPYDMEAIKAFNRALYGS